MARKRRIVRPRGTIGETRACHACGYNLQGLFPGGACPECGARMQAAARGTNTDNLVDAPLDYLHVLCVGLVTLAGAGAGLLIAAVLGGGLLRLYMLVWAVLAASAWGAGAWLVTRRRALGGGVVRDVALDAVWSRWLVRGTALAWPAATAALAAAVFLPIVSPAMSAIPGIPAPAGTLVPGEIELRRLATVLQVLALLGLAPLAVYLASLAAWAGDSGLMDRLRAGAWGVGVGGGGGLIAGVVAPVAGPGGLAGALVIAAMLGWGLMLLAAVLIVVSAVQLAHLSWWAISNSADQSAARARLALERAKHEEAMARRIPGPLAAGVSPIGPGTRVSGHSPGEPVRVPPRPAKRKS